MPVGVVPEAFPLGHRSKITRRLAAQKVIKRRPRSLAIAKRLEVFQGFYGGIERKFFDTTKTQVAMSTTWAAISPSSPTDIECLTIPAQGTGESEHIGRTYFINSILVKGLVSRSVVEGQSAPLGDLQWRILLVWDMQTNGLVINATDVMDAGSLLDVLSFRNLENSSRFIVLADTGVQVFDVFNMNEGFGNLFSSPASKQYWTLGKTFKNPIKVRTDGTTAKVGDVTDNSFSLIGITSNVFGRVEFESRMRFSEKRIKK